MNCLDKFSILEFDLSAVGIILFSLKAYEQANIFNITFKLNSTTIDRIIH